MKTLNLPFYLKPNHLFFALVFLAASACETPKTEDSEDDTVNVSDEEQALKDPTLGKDSSDMATVITLIVNTAEIDSEPVDIVKIKDNRGGQSNGNNRRFTTKITSDSLITWIGKTESTENNERIIITDITKKGNGNFKLISDPVNNKDGSVNAKANKQFDPASDAYYIHYAVIDQNGDTTWRDKVDPILKMVRSTE